MSTIWHRGGLRALLMVIPVILVVVLPIASFTAISLLPVAETAVPPDSLMPLLSKNSAENGYRAFWMDAFTTLLCPMLFLTVPILCSVISASSAFVGERENGTLETLFLAAVSARTVFNAKIAACTIVSVAISLVSFFTFAVTVTVADILISASYFLSFGWLVTVFLLMPVLSFFSVVFVSLIIKRVYNSAEALQTMGYLLLPFVVLYLAQFSGALLITPFTLLLITVILAILSIILFNRSAHRFEAERLLSQDTAEG